MNCAKNLLFIVLACGLSAAPLCLGQETFSEDDVEVSSILGVPIANAKAWVRGDVLVQLTESFDNVQIKPEFGPVGAVFSSKELRRFVFDFEEKIHLQAVVSNLDGTYFPAQVPVPKEIDRRDISAKIVRCDPPLFWKFDFQTGFSDGRLMQQKNQSQFLHRNRLVDVRGVWTAPHSGKFFSTAELRIRNSIWEQRRVARGLDTHSYDSDGNLHLTYSKPLEDERVFVTSVVIDAATQMPLKIHDYTEDKNGKIGLVGIANIEWEMLDEVYVPISMEIRRGETIGLEGRKVSGAINQTLKFHWFSVNEPLDTAAFSPDQIQSEEAIVRLLDPVANGAESLIEKEQQEQESKDDGRSNR